MPRFALSKPRRMFHTDMVLTAARYHSTYYDSQSGLYLPSHNEDEIRCFLDHRNDEGEPFVPHQLSKLRDEAEEMSDKLKRFVDIGIHGIFLPPISFPRDLRNIQTLSAIAPPDFFFFCFGKRKNDSASTNLSRILYYENSCTKNGDNDIQEDHFQNSLQSSVEKGLHTTLSITEDVYIDANEVIIEPVTLANNVASIIDAKGGCDFIWVSSKTKEGTSTTSSSDSSSEIVADAMVQICEELIYLDVAGATIKSRLLVDTLNEDILEDTMFAGVNKYVIENENQVQMVEAVATEQGKSLIRS